MTPDERDREEERILDVLDEYREAMAEGTLHSRSKIEDAERARKEAADRLVAVRAAMAERVLRRLAERGLTLTDGQRAMVMSCEDEGRLLDWLERASSAATASDVLSS